MKRRSALRGAVAAAASTTCLRALAQARRPGSVYRIGTLADYLGTKPFVAGMQARGWTEGRDFVFVKSGYERAAPNVDAAAKRLVDENVDMMYVAGTHAALAAHRLTKTIPIVMFACGYPVEAGLADSLARPGKNVTGNTMYAGTGVWSKMLELLRETKPGVKRIGLFWTYTPPRFARAESDACFAELRQAAKQLDLSIHVAEVVRREDTEDAIAQLDAARPDALIVTDGHATGQSVMRHAVRRRLPTITDIAWELSASPYPLLSYGPRMEELLATSLDHVDRIMRGAKPAELPIQQPSKFMLVLSMEAAKTIGLQVPQALLMRADVVLKEKA